jgi:hypothetical protein
LAVAGIMDRSDFDQTVNLVVALISDRMRLRSRLRDYRP